MDKIAVLIPCYNEAKTIEKTVKDFKRDLPEATIYVYDNNSTDNTDKIAKSAGAIVRYERKQGKGNVLKRMFREIDAECYIITDGDNTYPSSSARKMADLVLNEDVDMVVGDRLSSTYFKENKRPFHNIGNVLVKKLINLIYKSDIKDIMTGYRAFNYQFIKTFPILSHGFEVETEMTIHSLDKDLYVENLVIEYKDRPEGSVSKLNTYVDGFKVLKTIMTLYKNYKPFEFFCYLALILFIIGSIFLIPVILEYIKIGLVPRIPTFLVSIFMYICSIQSFFGGLILESNSRKAKQDFVIKYSEYTDKLKILKNK